MAPWPPPSGPGRLPSALLSAARRRWPPRSARRPGWTGCYSTSSTARAARSRSATWCRPPGATGCPPWSGSSPRLASGWGGSWTAGPRASCCPGSTRWTRSPGLVRAPWLRYPPAGDRGVATSNRASRFGLDPGALDRANSEVLGVVQIESAAAVGNAEPIAALDGGGRAVRRPARPSATISASPATSPRRLFTEAIEHVLAAWPPPRQGLRPARHRRAPPPPGVWSSGWSFLVAIGSTPPCWRPP